MPLSKKTDAFEVLNKAIKAAKPGGYIWVRTGGKEDWAFSELNIYAYQYPYEVKRIDDDVFIAPCTCSGEYKIDSHLFFGQAEIAAHLAYQGMMIIHSQLMPEFGKANIMYGEDWYPDECKRKSNGFITVLAQKP